MGDASRHFSWSEGACKCPDPNCPGKTAHLDRLLIVGLEELHERAANTLNVAIRIIINSGCRCPAYDMQVSPKAGGPGEHSRWTAADIVMERRPSYSYNTQAWVPVHPTYVYALAEACPVWANGAGGMGLYDTFVHLDVREQGARWRDA